MIKALIFDYNGVLTARGTFQGLVIEYCQKKGKNPQELENIVTERWNLARVGKIDSQLFWQNIASYLGYDQKQLRQEWITRFPLRQELLGKIKQYRTQYKTALLTNEVKDWMEESISKNKLHDYFDAIITSYEAGVAKPDPKIFLLTLDKLGVKAEECVFIDDQAKNVDAAQKLGFNVIQFVFMEEMEQSLGDLGIKADH